jgi:copper transport protein
MSLRPVRPVPRRFISWLGALALALALLAAGAGVARAHSGLAASAPAANAVLEAAPGELRLWFSEESEPRFSVVRLLDSSGRQVDAVGPLRRDPGDATQLVATLQPLPDGIYTISWRTLSSIDGHVVMGSFAFAVGRDQVPAGGLRPVLPAEGDGAGSRPLDVAVRWLGYVGMGLLFGGLAFVPLILSPALARAERTGKAPGRGGSKRAPVASQPARAALPPALLPLLAAAWALSVLILVAGALLQAASSLDIPPLDAAGAPLVALLTGTRYGTLFWVRWVELVALGGILMLLRGRGAEGRPAPMWVWWVGLELAALVLLPVAASSHAAAGPTPIPATLVHWVHTLAASFWVGGLAALLVTLPWLRSDASGLWWVASPLVARFSLVAIPAVAVLVLTGLFRSVSEVARPDNLLDTAYGMALLAKLALVPLLLALAGANFLVIRRRMAAAAAAADPGVALAPWHRRLRRAVGGELLLISAVLLATGVLATLPPGRDAFGPGEVFRGQADDLRVVLAVNPGRAGFNVFDIHLRDGLGRAIDDAEKVALLFLPLEGGAGATEVVAERVVQGRYLAQGGYISAADGARVQLLVRRAGLEDGRVILPVTLPVR